MILQAKRKDELEVGDLIYVYFDTAEEEYYAEAYVAAEHQVPSGVVVTVDEDDMVGLKVTGTIGSRGL